MGKKQPTPKTTHPGTFKPTKGDQTHKPGPGEKVQAPK
jgi:hypothetical protein